MPGGQFLCFHGGRCLQMRQSRCVLTVFFRGRFRPALFRVLLHCILGTRLWLGVGFLLHIGIDLFINVGTFPELMVSVYFVWLSGSEIDALGRFAHSRWSWCSEAPVAMRRSP